MFHRNPMLEIPVVIGTYPISDEYYLLTTNATNQTTFASSAPPYEGYAYGSNESIDYSSELPPYPDEGILIGRGRRFFPIIETNCFRCRSANI